LINKPGGYLQGQQTLNKVVKYHKSLLILTTLCTIVMVSCKLDRVPASELTTGNSDETVLGINVIGKKIYDGYLTSAWKTSFTVQEYYDTANVVVSGISTANKFSAVKLNDNVKTISYTDLSAGNTLATGTYELSTSENVLYIKFSGDPFSRSKNTPVRITRLNTASMAWVAIDPKLLTVDGKKVRQAYRVVFFK
jgi:hypothetical protein